MFVSGLSASKTVLESALIRSPAPWLVGFLSRTRWAFLCTIFPRVSLLRQSDYEIPEDCELIRRISNKFNIRVGAGMALPGIYRSRA